MSEKHRKNRWILAIADDLTGALEIGAKFAGQGIAAQVTTDTRIDRMPAVAVLVIDTETRHLPEAEAAAVVEIVARTASDFSPWMIYKKTDSTLRGNIAAEFRALRDVFAERRLLYAPAYPDMGRTVRSGQLFVNGLPVQQTAFASDPLNPILESDIAAVLGGTSVEVFDGESNEDVLATARLILSTEVPHIAAGPGALAGALAQCVDLPRGEIRSLPRLSRCLVVNGSLHPASAMQVELARNQDGFQFFDEDPGGVGLERALRTGECIRRWMERSPVDGLIVFGGDTAFGVHYGLGSQPFEAYGEVAPGVPLARCGDLFWITKAGGFGGPDILCDIRRRLT